MSTSPRHPTRLGEYTPDGSYYPRELVEADKILYKINDDGSATPLNDFEDRVAELETQMADVLYKAISITSFSHNKSTIERGVTITDVTLNWAINKTPKALTLDSLAIDTALRTKSFSGLGITWDNNKTWTLKATDERGATSTKTTSITFHNGVYYGVASEPSSYNSSFILSLSRELRGNKKPSFTVNAGAGQFIYYALPKRMGTCSFTVGGFTGGFGLVGTISFTNASGYTEDYYVYKSDSANLGSTTVVVS